MTLLLAALLLLAAGPAGAQIRSFNCIGAEQLEEDVFDVPFRPGAERAGEAGRSPLAAASDLAKAEPERNICVIGHAQREGGQTTSTQLAAKRARSIAQALSAEYGIERDRIRAEARNPGFSQRTNVRAGRNVTIVVLPAAAAAP